jgi:hypothetical protein
MAVASLLVGVSCDERRLIEMKCEQNRPVLIVRFLFIPILFFNLAVTLPAAEANLKRGDTVELQNWEKVKGMVGEPAEPEQARLLVQDKRPRILNHPRSSPDTSET